MKKLSLLLVLFSYNFCYAGDLSNDIINYFDTEITKSIQLKRENALIRNIVQLEFYQNIKDNNFPLNYLNKDDKQVFIKSLAFNEKGLTHYNYKVLKMYSERQVYQILSLFGFDDNTGAIKNTAVKACLKGSMKCGNDYKEYKCASKGSCVWALNYICTSNC